MGKSVSELNSKCIERNEFYHHGIELLLMISWESKGINIHFLNKQAGYNCMFLSYKLYSITYVLSSVIILNFRR